MFKQDRNMLCGLKHKVKKPKVAAATTTTTTINLNFFIHICLFVQIYTKS